MDKRIVLPAGYQLSSGKNSYTIEKYISAGSNSLIYQAWYQDTLMPESIHTVLIKELYPFDPLGGIYRDEEMNLRIREESEELFEFHKKSYLFGNRAHLMLTEEGSGDIAENLDSFEQNYTLYTVLASRKGQVLDEMIRQKKEFPSLTDMITCICNILYSLRRFHAQGLLHLDISPDNIFLLAPKEDRFPTDILLLDFNSVYSMEEKNGIENRYYLGKPGYMAPEVVLHQEEELGPWTDLYSVSAVLYCLLAKGELPKDMELNHQKELISPYSGLLLHEKEVAAQQVNKILRKGLQILPKERYNSADEMLKDLQELLDILNGNLRIPVEPVSAGEKQERKPAKSGGKGKAALIAAGIVLIAALGYTVGRTHVPNKEDTKLDLTRFPLKTDSSVVLTQQNVRYPLIDNIMEVQVQGDTAVRILLKDFAHELNRTDVLATYSIFPFYNGEGDKRGWQNAGLTFDFFYTEDNTLHMEVPFQETEEFPLEYIGVAFQNFNYDDSNVVLDIEKCTLVDGEGTGYEMTDLVGSHLLFFDKDYWQQNLITSQNQDYVESFGDVYGGKLVVDASVGYMDSVFEVNCTSDHPEIASVDDCGRVKGLRQGVATLTVTIRNKESQEERQTQMLVNVTSKLP